MRTALAAICLLAASPAAAQTFTCNVQRIIDGDTFDCTHGPRVRSAGIDAPERTQAKGLESAQALADLVAGQPLTCITFAHSYARTVAACFLPDKRSVEELQVRAGWAWDWPAYSGGRFASMQYLAQIDKLGIWSAATPPVEPWRYRASQRRADCGGSDWHEKCVGVKR